MGYFGIPIRNGLPIGLGSLVGFGIRSFEPNELFAAGEQGTWYDPSDFSTLFQDSAGTTPVTGVEQVVGLMLDKSKGLVLGPEVVVNPLAGTFGASYSIVGDTIVRNGSTGTAVLTPVGGVIPATNKTYLVTFTASGVTGDSTAVRVGGGTAYGPFAGNGTFTLRVPGGGTSGAITFLPWAGGAATAVYSNISVRELPGNHATATGSARPTLSARVNLLTKTEQFDDAVWTKINATATSNASTAPNGTNTADKAIATTTNAQHYVYVTPTMAAATYTLSTYAKAAEYSFLQINCFRDSTYSAFFDLSNGTVGTKTANVSASISSVKDGWYNCSITFTVSTGGTSDLGFRVAQQDNVTTFAGDNVSGIFIWGADLRVSNDGVGIPAYQRVNTATDYDTAGFPVYLAFGGAQAMSTPANVDFSGTDKMTVFAGVRKLSDAAQAVVAELSATIASNNGTFLLAAPDGATQTYGWDSKGTTQVDAVATGFAAPITNVVTGTADIAGDSCIIRVNGTVADTEIGDQGSGNFGSYPLFIGARNLASLFFTGRLYSLITRGAATDSASVAATEAWVNQRTAAY